MLSYRFMQMDMDGMRDGTEDMSSQDIFDEGYAVAPTGMRMQMHMFGGMYAPTDWVTLMVMANYTRKYMDHLTKEGTPPRQKMGETFRREIDGWGDLVVGGLLRAFHNGGHRGHFNLGISVPTGSIDHKDPEQLAYPMQTSSGTWDPKLGFTYTGMSSRFSWGGQAIGTLRLGTNKADFAYGDIFDSSAWSAWRVLRWASVSARARYEHVGAIEGVDTRFMPGMSPPMEPENHGGDFVEGGLGINMVVQGGALKGHRLAIEFLTPLYQDLNGPQLKRDYSLVVGWQKSL